MKTEKIKYLKQPKFNEIKAEKDIKKSFDKFEKTSKKIENLGTKANIYKN